GWPRSAGKTTAPTGLGWPDSETPDDDVSRGTVSRETGLGVGEVSGESLSQEASRHVSVDAESGSDEPETSVWSDAPTGAPTAGDGFATGGSSSGAAFAATPSSTSASMPSAPVSPTPLISR